jgi:16S rRNA (adenine1518-N6/adenine1519-N6)-dimethyltransferase
VIVRIVRHSHPPAVSFAELSAVARAAFSQRRKTLRNALGPLAGSVAAAEQLLESAGVDPGARAERIGVEGFVSVARAFGNRNG